MAMLETDTDRSHSCADILCHLVAGIDVGAFIGKCRSALVHEDGTSQASTTDQSTLLAADCNIVSDLLTEVRTYEDS